MTYDQFRMIAKDGDLLFLTVNKKNILSRITSYFAKSPYTHVAFVFWYDKRLMISESTTHGGNRIVSASQYANRNIDWIPAPVEWSLIEDVALEHSGTADYGWFSAFYIGVREVMLMHFNIPLPQNKNNRNKACSEFVAECIELEDTDISPGVLYKYLTTTLVSETA